MPRYMLHAMPLSYTCQCPAIIIGMIAFDGEVRKVTVNDSGLAQEARQLGWMLPACPTPEMTHAFKQAPGYTPKYSRGIACTSFECL